VVAVWPVPRISEENEAFWTGGREGALFIARCGDCGYYVHPPSPRCPRCYGENVAPERVSGRGHVYTYTVNRREWTPGLEVPYILAVVELEEQPALRLLTNVVGCAPDRIAIDLPVEVEFVERDPAFVPVFRPRVDD
jgi:uncharacterized OB-fold protein